MLRYSRALGPWLGKVVGFLSQADGEILKRSASELGSGILSLQLDVGLRRAAGREPSRVRTVRARERVSGGSVVSVGSIEWSIRHEVE